MKLTDQHQDTLLAIAKHSALTGLEQSSCNGFETLESVLEQRLDQNLEKENDVLSLPAATFVTLHKFEQLRGCIGSLQAVRSLAEDVAHNAFNAAFRDPRFNPVKQTEFTDLNIEISVLTKPEPMSGSHSFELFLEQLQQNRDGLILTEGYKRATFLPSVWEQVANKEEFVRHLMNKAGITQWSEQIQCERYYSISFSQDWNEIKSI